MKLIRSHTPKNKSINVSIDSSFYLIISFMVTFFMINRYIYFNLLVLCAILLFQIVKGVEKFRINITIFPMCIFIFLLLFQSLINPSNYFSFDIALKEISRNIIYLLLIIILQRMEIQWSYFIKVWTSIFVIVFIILMMQYFKFANINNILTNIYYSSVQLTSASYDNISQFRAGSVFLNPNVLAIFTLMMLSIFIYENTQLSRIKIILAVIGIVLSGSRTGFIITIILLLIGFFRRNRPKVNIKHIIKYIIISIVFIGIILFLVSSSLLKGLRIFEVRAGIHNSYGIKIERFIELLRDFNVFNFFIGLGAFQYSFSKNMMIDFDIGYIITYYGLMGIILYTSILWIFYKLSKNRKFEIKSINISLLIIMIVFGLTAGFYFDLRIFSIFLVLFCIKIKNDDIDTSKEKDELNYE